MANYSLVTNQLGGKISGRAAIFINWMIPLGMGHVGWGFQQNSLWNYGGLETAGVIIDKGANNNTNNCLGSFDEMVKNMKITNRPGCNGGGYPYHEYKIISVASPKSSAALDQVKSIRQNGYGLHANNCMDAVFNVIKAYAGGNDHILPWPSSYWAPRWWYAAIPGQSIFLQSQSATGNWFQQHNA